MPYNGSQWDETNPTNATLANEIDDNMRDMKQGVSGRMRVEHIWPASQTGTAEAGGHAFVSFAPQSAPPSLATYAGTAQFGVLYASSGNGNLYLRASNGTSYIMFNSAVGGLSIIGAQYSSTGSAGELVIGASGGGLVILPPASTSGQYLVSSSGAAPAWTTPAASMGSSLSRSFATTYQATSDGFVYGYTSLTSLSSQVVCKMDSNATPSTVVQQIYGVMVAGAPGVSLSFSFPVQKNNYYSIAIASTPGGAAFFTPIGS